MNHLLFIYCVDWGVRCSLFSGTRCLVLPGWEFLPVSGTHWTLQRRWAFPPTLLQKPPHWACSEQPALGCADRSLAVICMRKDERWQEQWEALKQRDQAHWAAASVHDPHTNWAAGYIRGGYISRTWEHKIKCVTKQVNLALMQKLTKMGEKKIGHEIVYKKH